MQGSGIADDYDISKAYVIIGPDGIVRFVSNPHQLNVNTIRSVIDEWLPIDEPTFDFTVDETHLDFTDGNQIFAFHGHVNNLLNEDQNLIYTLTPIQYPDEMRQSSVCTFEGCYPPASGALMYTVPYVALQQDDMVQFDLYNIVDTDSFPAISPIVGDYIFDVRVYAENDPEEYIEYRFTIDDQSVSVDPRPRPVPETIDLLSNYPNPFNPSTTVSFHVDQAGPVKVTVYDILGRNVAELINSTLTAGSYTAFWEARNANGIPLPSGSYWVRLATPTANEMHRIVLLR